MEFEQLEDYDEAMVTWLAAFLANRLDSTSRSDLMSFLSNNPDARELFLMSYKLYRDNSETGRQRNGDTRRSDSAPERAERPNDAAEQRT
jgi:hypothetical protein